MKIIFPKEYLQYINALILEKFGDNELDVVKKLFEYGLDNVIDDVSMNCGGPDMSDSLIDYLKDFQDKAVFELPSPITKIGELEPISRHFGYSLEHTKTIIFVTGLTWEGYLVLRESKKYETESEFRNMVDNMPHDVGLESKEKIMNYDDDDF